MSEAATLLGFDLLSSTLVLSATAVGALLLLRLLRISSPAIHRGTWTLVLLQGWLIFRLTLPIPWYDPIPVSDAPHSGSGNGKLVDDAAAEPQPAELALPDQPSPAPADHSQPAETAQTKPSLSWAVFIVGIWIAGIVLTFAYWCAAYLSFVRQIQPLEPANEAEQAEWHDELLKQGIRSRIPLLISQRHGPLLSRLPQGNAVIVPRDLWRRLDEQARRAILRHELAHYCRGDIFKSLAIRVLLIPHWFNPLAWWVVRRFDEAAEWACDEAAIGGLHRKAPAYAQTLLEFESSAIRPQSLQPALQGNSLSRRIRRILAFSPNKESAMKKSLLALAAAVALTLNVVRLELVAQETPAEAQNAAAPDSALATQATKNAGAGKKPRPRELPQSVQRGIGYLYSQQNVDGSWKLEQGNGWDVGTSALCTFALLKCGIPPEEPHVAKSLKYLRRQKLDRTYEVSLQTLALCAAGQKGDLLLIQRNVKLLETAQFKNGPWKGCWSYRSEPNRFSPMGDNSNSEFAIWALDAAATAGANVDRKTWQRAYDYWRNSQLAAGGWSYTTTGKSATGSMTCSGIASLVICHRHLNTDKQLQLPDIDLMIEPSYQWMEQNFSVQRNPGTESWQLYYLMVLRRAGEEAEYRRFGDHDWYVVGDTYLTKVQGRESGAWKGAGHSEGPLVATAMSLLFLRDGPPKVTQN